MRRGCWRGNVILVFKYMKDYYCFTDADSSEPSLLDHFPGLLIHSCQSSGPSRRWIGLTCSPLFTRNHSVSQAPLSVPKHPRFTHIGTQQPHSSFHLLSCSSQACWEPTLSIKCCLAWVWLSLLPTTNSTHVLSTRYVSGPIMTVTLKNISFTLQMKILMPKKKIISPSSYSCRCEGGIKHGSNSKIYA